MAMKRPLFSEEEASSSSEACSSESLRVNAGFAKAFEEKETKRLKMKEEALGLEEESEDDDDDSEDESEDEDGAEVTPALELQIVQTINAIRRKDAKVYDGTTKFFDEGEGEGEAVDSSSKPKRKAATYKDVLREQLLRGDDGREEEHSYAYDEEQRSLREGLKLAASSALDDDDEFLRPSTKAATTTTTDTASVEAALRTELQTFETLSSAKRDDAFLADFVAKQKWKAPLPQTSRRPLQSPAEDSDESSSAASDAEAFEARYNFRFEQQGAATVATHARGSSSLRREESKRKEKRRAAMLEKTKEKKKHEDDALSALKRQKLQELNAQRQRDKDARVAAIREAAGLDADVDLEDDFDPETYDAGMRQLFDDDYYHDHDDDYRHEQDYERDEQDEQGDDEQEEGASFPPSSSSSSSSGGVFKYTAVPADDFGLTADEILETDDKDLAQLVTLKKLAPYRESPYTLSAKKRKHWRQAIAKKKSDRETTTSKEALAAKLKNRQSRLLRKNTKNNEAPPTTTTKEEDDAGEAAAKTATATQDDVPPPPRRKKKKKKNTNNTTTTTKEGGVSKARLQSYGLVT